MTTISSCMDRYMNRHMIPPPMPHHQTSNQGNYFHQKNIAAGGPTCRAGGVGTGAGGSHHQQSQQHHHHHQNYVPNCYQNTNGWAGVPLISTASRRPKKFNNNRHIIKSTNQLTDFDENAMSRLAIHAHGAPLILAGRYRNKSSQHKREQSKIASGTTFNKTDSDRNSFTLLHHKQQITHHTSNNNNNNNNVNNNTSTANTVTANGTLDVFSVNSDESSNSSNGINVDTCLPRIIKPRKRRKKDRKPNINTQQSDMVQTVTNSMNNAMINNNNNTTTTNFNCIKNHFETPTVQDNKITIQTGAIGPTNNALPNEIIQRYEQELNDLPDGVTDTQNKIDGLMGETSSCSCRLCDPLCRIWAFPLRRSCSDKSETEIRQNKNVGVIGSNRIMTVRNEWRSSPQLLPSPMLCDRFEFIGSRKGSFSDSGDSGCDILSGLSFSDDILRSNSRNDNHSTITSPLTENLEFNFTTTVTDNNSSIFGESINEISRKLMESMDLSGRSSASEDSGSVFSDSVFSDDFFMNFESLQQQSSELFSAGQAGQMFFNPNQTNHAMNESESIMSAKQNNVTNLNDSFVFIEKDRGDEVINCFDMLWSNRRLQPVEE